MPVNATLRWNQDRVITRARAVMLQRGQLAASALEEQVKARISVPSPPPSRPGEPPHRTKRGALYRSIHARARLLSNRIRVSLVSTAEVGNGKWNLGSLLQKGTRRMLARPFAGLPPDARLVVDFLSGRRKS